MTRNLVKQSRKAAGSASQGLKKKKPSGTRKVFNQGTHRIYSPAETVAKAQRFFRPMGITRVATVTGLDCIGIPVVVVCRPNARSLAVSQGKGGDIDSARASGIMEAVELFHAERVTLPLKLASWAELRRAELVIDITKLSRTTVSTFEADQGILWVEGDDLLSGDRKWLPFELVHTNYTLPFPTGSGAFVMSSNGLASGNHLLEAIVHGLCEVIERDAVTLHTLSSTDARSSRRVRLSTIDDERCVALLDAYRSADVTVGVWDVTSDIGIATFYCTVMDSNPHPLRPIGMIEGMGCHPSREIALMRALTEAAQARLTLITGSRDDNGRSSYEAFQDRAAIERSHSLLLERGGRDFKQVPSYDFETLEEDLATLLEHLATRGIEEAVVVDLTKPEFQIPVVRVVVPGLETYHHVQGYSPGARAIATLRAREQGRT